MAVGKLIIDKLDGMWAAVDYNGYRFNIPHSMLPAKARVGDILTFTFGVNEEDTDPVKLRAWTKSS